MRLPWKAPLRPTSTPTAPTSPSGSAGAASPQPRVAWCWVMAQLGSGTPPANGSLQPLRAQPVSRQTSCTPRRAIHFRRDQRKHAWGDGALGRTGRWQTICRSPCPAGPSHVPRRGHPMRAVPLPQSGSHALPEIPLPRTLYFHRRGRGGMPSRHRYPAQARRYAWDRAGRKCPHRPALLQAQRAVRRLLGAPRGPDCRVSPSNLTCAPLEPRL